MYQLMKSWALFLYLNLYDTMIHTFIINTKKKLQNIEPCLLYFIYYNDSPIYQTLWIKKEHEPSLSLFVLM